MSIVFADLADDNVDLPLIDLPEIPLKSFDFKALTLVITGDKKSFRVEAEGPYGGSVVANTIMPTHSNDADAMGKALFPDKVKAYYYDLLDKTALGGKGIRIQLDFRNEAKSYANWPWEQTRLSGEYLLSNARVTISRTLSSPRPALPFEDTSKPYRILFVMACPDKLNADIKPSLEKDLEYIREALKPLEDDGLIEINVLADRNATLKNLKYELNQKEYQALCVASHGGSGSRLETKKHKGKESDEWYSPGDDGMLVFDDGEGNPKPVFGRDLCSSLNGCAVRLVFFNTMGTAYGSSPEGEGIAETLLDTGIPAVVAFQGAVLTSWASEFAEAFFSTLPKLNSLELATLAGREAIMRKDSIHQPTNWALPMLFTRFREGEKVFTGEIGGKISAFVNENGEVEIIEQTQDQSDATIFKRQINSLNGLSQKVEDIEVRTTLQNQILEATRLFQKGSADEAIGLLTTASMTAVAAIKKQLIRAERLRIKKQREKEEIENQRQMMRRKQLERTIVLIIGGIMMLVVGLIASFMDAGEELAVLGLPIPVVLWSFIGGVGATLYAFVGTQKYKQTEPLRIDWLIGRPFVGVIMGSVVFLAVATSLSAIGGDVPLINDSGNTGGSGGQAGDPSHPYLLWALSFIGGFSDKFALLLFDNLVGKFTTEKEDNGVDNNHPETQEEGQTNEEG